MVYSQYNKTVLSSGLTVVTEKIPFVRSISIGVWVKAGTRHEPPEKNGIAHFLEHLMFNGTEKRSARDIALSLESVGGNLNAFTSKEMTCYYAEVLDNHLPLAVDVLSDMVCHSTFPEKEIEKERSIILDEIDSVEDTPDDLVQEVFVEKLYPNHTLGLPILGNKKSVAQIDREAILEFYRSYYHSGNIVIAAAGNLEHQQLVELCEKYFQFPHQGRPVQEEPPHEIGHGKFFYKRNVKQAHICMGVKGLAYTDRHKYDLLLLNTLLGSGMSSRLFQSIREQYGIAYSIYSFVDFFRDNGLFAVYLGTERHKMEKALRLVYEEIRRVKNEPLSQEELNRLKSQLKGNLVLGLESTARRMSRLARLEIYLNHYEDIDSVIERIDRLQLDEVLHTAQLLFDETHLLQVAFVPR